MKHSTWFHFVRRSRSRCELPLLAICGLALGFSSARAALPVINEVKINPPDDDTHQYIELRGTPNAAVGATMWLVILEGDASADRGEVDIAISLANRTFGANGLITIKAPGGHLPNPNSAVIEIPGLDLPKGAQTIMLIPLAAAPEVGEDYDGNNDGTLEDAPFASAVAQDSVGWKDSSAADIVYAKGPGATVADLTPPGFAYRPDAATRFPSSLAQNSTAAWYFGELVEQSDSLKYITPRNEAGTSRPAACSARVTLTSLMPIARRW